MECRRCPRKNPMLNIIKHYKLWFGVSAVLVLVALIALSVYGMRFGIDFNGGALTQVKFAGSVPPTSEIRQALVDANFRDAVVQPAGEHSVIVRTGPQQKEEH